jgi:flagellar biosynthesis protein FliR
MITLAVGPLTTFFLITIRVGTVLLFPPFEAIRQLPIHTRLLLVFILSVLIAAHCSSPQLESQLTLSCLAELCNGLILALCFYATFAIFQVAGHLIDTQLGLNALALFNPSEHAHDPLSSKLLLMMATLFFFAIDGHCRLIQGLILSFAIISPGQIALFNGFTPIMQQFALLFSLSFMLASPLVLALLIIDAASGIITRSMPQMSVYFLVLPIKILLGYFLFAVLLNYINPVMELIFQICFSSFNQVMS